MNFFVSTRLPLGLLEKDLSDRFNISQREVSQIFATWIDCPRYCLGQLTFKSETTLTNSILLTAYRLLAYQATQTPKEKRTSG